MGIQGVGSAIREERLNQGLTQAQLAKKARVSREWLSGVERGERFGAELSKVLEVFSVLELDLFLSSRGASNAPSQTETAPGAQLAQEQFPLTTDEVTRQAIKAIASSPKSDPQAMRSAPNIAEVFPEDLLKRITATQSRTSSERLENRLRQTDERGQQP